HDAFEAALVDTAGHTLVHSYTTDRDAFFNLTEDQPAALGVEASLVDKTVTLDLSGIAPGTQGTLIFRLVNNDSDVNTSVEIVCAALPGVVRDQLPATTIV